MSKAARRWSRKVGRDGASGHKAQKDIKDFIGVTAKVVVKATGELPRSEGKAVRVVDHRKKQK
jgi:phenylacetate-CoA ligase